MVFKVVACKLLIFLELSPMYPGGVYVIKLVFLLLICLLSWGGGSLSQEPRRVNGKLRLLPYAPHTVTLSKCYLQDFHCDDAT